MVDIMKLKKAYTHAGVFHADDVFATAFLLMINSKIEIKRTNKPPENYNDEVLVFDIGGGRYDHHEEDNKKELREDGTPYAAFGKLWRDYSYYLAKKEVADRVERDFVVPIDVADNTGEVNHLSSVIATMNPMWDEDANPQEAFDDAVSMSKKILERCIAQKESEERAREVVLASKVNEGVLVLKKYVPWKETVVNEMPEIMFVAYPSLRGGYNLQTVPINMDSKIGRVMFPEEWLGKTNAELGITFCHPGNFLLSTKMMSQAINVAHLILRK